MDYLDRLLSILSFLIFFLRLRESCKVAVAIVSCWFLRTHCYCKRHRFSVLAKPLVKSSSTCVTTIMRSQMFVLIFNLGTKIMVVCLFNRCNYFALFVMETSLYHKYNRSYLDCLHKVEASLLLESKSDIAH